MSYLKKEISFRHAVAILTMVLLVLLPMMKMGSMELNFLFGDHKTLVMLMASITGGAFAGYVIHPKNKMINAMCGVVCSTGITTCGLLYSALWEVNSINKPAFYVIMTVGALPSLVLYFYFHEKKA